MKANRIRLDPNTAQAALLDVLGDRVSALWNAANYQCRQAFLSGDHVPTYPTLDCVFRSHATYRALPSDIAQETLKKLAEAWKSFRALRRLWQRGALEDKPGLPKYRKDRNAQTRPTDFIPIKTNRSYRINAHTIEVTLPKDLRGQGRLEITYRGLHRYTGKGRRAEILYDTASQRWFMIWTVETPAPQARHGRVAGIDLGLRIMASLSIAGMPDAWHFLGREAMKDFEYWSAKIAAHQAELATRGKKTSRRLQRYYRLRRLRLAHAIDAMAKRIAAVCRLHKVGEVVIGWPKGILLETTANATWQRLRHGFWSFAMVATRLEQALQRVGIHTARVGERGTSSHCPACGSADVVRAPRHVLRCRDCALHIHADQAASRNMIRQKHTQLSWAGLEASPRPHTFRWSSHRWCVVSNPAIPVADRAA